MVIPLHYFESKESHACTQCTTKVSTVERTQVLDFKFHLCTLLLVILEQKLLNLFGPRISRVGPES